MILKVTINKYESVEECFLEEVIFQVDSIAKHEQWRKRLGKNVEERKNISKGP